LDDDVQDVFRQDDVHQVRLRHFVAEDHQVGPAQKIAVLPIVLF
jgi:hypothetical protein